MNIETNYSTVIENGEVLKKSGRHTHESMCDCDFDAPLGQYRDVVVEYGGRKYIFYHSTAIVVELANGNLRLSNGDWTTKSTKERINRHLPSDFKLIQIDSDWYIETEESKVEFVSGMVIDVQDSSVEIHS